MAVAENYIHPKDEKQIKKLRVLKSLSFHVEIEKILVLGAYPRVSYKREKRVISKLYCSC